MYQYIWDPETGGPLLISELSKFSKEPRPVYYKELDILGFDKYWNYPKDDSAPLMWAETNNYIYFGRTVARTKGGSYYNRPEIEILDEPEPDNKILRHVDIDGMIRHNAALLETLSQETIQRVYNAFTKYRKKIDVFYVAFSGGKDSVVALDIVSKALPHNDFLVLFSDTQMEFPDTYVLVDKMQETCAEEGIRFYQTKSKLKPSNSWIQFGPPSTTYRWCCSVHKTSPQILFLRTLLNKSDFTGMAFTGVRADESLSRSSYDYISKGQKHNGQLSCHTILEWNSAELYLYIYANHLLINEAYKRGNARVGCLVCPNSSGKHEFIKRYNYQQEVDNYLNLIKKTSGKLSYTEKDLENFINKGYWRTRKSGRELNVGLDKFEVSNDLNIPSITVYDSKIDWQKWAKTIGDITVVENNLYLINFRNKLYQIAINDGDDATIFKLANYENTKNDIKFKSLFRSVIIKSLYCIKCGECEAECKHDCINFNNSEFVGDNCTHCLRCHDIQDHCLRYASIKNKKQEYKLMKSIDRYFTFGTRDEWLDHYVKHKGQASFWSTDGDGLVANKKKDAFVHFIEDAGIAKEDKSKKGKKIDRLQPTTFGEVIFREGAFSDVSWALILCNLVYTPTYNWFVKNLQMDILYTPSMITSMLEEVMENDDSGKGKRNVVDALKITMAKTPLGRDAIFADCEIDEKISSTGKETISLKSITRCVWKDFDPRVVLYCFFLFSEACDGYCQFTLTDLLDLTIERDGISPAALFGFDSEMMIPMLNGLAVNYPDFISVSFSLGLDTINLNPEKTAEDVLALF